MANSLAICFLEVIINSQETLFEIIQAPLVPFLNHNGSQIFMKIIRQIYIGIVEKNVEIEHNNRKKRKDLEKYQAGWRIATELLR